MCEMMEDMMSKMCLGMKVEVQFCTTMMPKCLIMASVGIRIEEKEELKKRNGNQTDIRLRESIFYSYLPQI